MYRLFWARNSQPCDRRPNHFPFESLSAQILLQENILGHDHGRGYKGQEYDGVLASVCLTLLGSGCIFLDESTYHRFSNVMMD